MWALRLCTYQGGRRRNCFAWMVQVRPLRPLPNFTTFPLPTSPLMPTPSRDVTKLRRHTLRATQDQSQQPTDEYSRCHRIEEVYVLAEVDWLKRQPNVKRAMKEWGLQVHAFVFDKERGTCVRLVERKS